MKYAKEELVKMYKQMLTTRKYLDKMLVLIGQGKLAGFFHLSNGQEAIGTGIINAIGPEDYILPTHRQQTVLVNKLDINKFTAELLGRVEGYCRGKGFEFHTSSLEDKVLPIAAVLGSGGPLATGVAMALKLDKKNGVVVVSCGDGAASEGNMHEAMNIAAVFKLPIVFVIENNGWGISQPVHKQCAAKDLSLRAAAYGMKGVSVDGNDVVKVRETMEEAIKSARQGNPNVVEFKVVRFRAHFEGDPQLYRDLSQVEEGKKNDCILMLEKKLIDEMMLTNNEVKDIYNETQKKVDEAFEYGFSCALPDEAETLDPKQVYASLMGGVQ